MRNAIAITAMLALVSTASAGLVVYESFDYPYTETGGVADNNIVGDAVSGTGLTGNWTAGSAAAVGTVQSGSIGVGTLPTSSNSLLLEATANNGHIYAALTDNSFLAPGKSDAEETKTFWMSFTFETPTPTFEGAVSIFTGNQQQPLAMVYGTNGTVYSPTTQGMLQTYNSMSADGNSGISANTPYLFVARVDVHNDASQAYTVDSYVWQYDATSGVPTVEPTLATAKQSLIGAAIADNRVPIDGVGGTAYLGIQGHNTRDMYFDEIRLGTEFVDVVPEPATMGLLSLGGLALLRRKRR